MEENRSTTAEGSSLDDRPLVSPYYTARLLQNAFLLMFLLATALLLVISIDTVLNPLYLAGSAFVLIASALPALPAFRNPYYRPWMLAMPVLDYLAFVLLRLEGTGGVTNPMVMMLALPAIWLGLIKSRLAIVILTPLALAVVVPDAVQLARGSLADPTADRAIMLLVMFPIVMILGAYIAYSMASLLADRQVELVDEQSRRAETARDIERTRRLLDTVLDTLDVGVVVTTPQGEPVLMNRVLREHPELTRDGADPWTTFHAIPAFSADKVTRIPQHDSTLRRVQLGQVVTDRLVWIGTPGTRQHGLSVSASHVHTADGTHLANVMVVKDVTDFLQALEAKDAFIGTVSHELRTPLTTMAGFLELVLEKRHELAPEIVSWLEVMERSVQRQHMLVRDLLTAAGSRNAPLSIERRAHDLAGVVRESAAAVASEAAVKRVDVTVTGDGAVGCFDALRMAQVAENLLTNAVRYTPEGGSVHVSTAIDGHELVLTVRDTGVGITPEDQERLFERFFRGADARASAIRGVGLGLPIVKAIVDAHSGSIDVDSVVGSGTTITVRLPR